MINNKNEKIEKNINALEKSSNKIYKPVLELTDTQYEIIENIGNLSNHILSNSASITLIR